jgi:hypothetical protein
MCQQGHFCPSRHAAHHPQAQCSFTLQLTIHKVSHAAHHPQSTHSQVAFGTQLWLSSAASGHRPNQPGQPPPLPSRRWLWWASECREASPPRSAHTACSLNSSPCQSSSRQRHMLVVCILTRSYSQPVLSLGGSHGSYRTPCASTCTSVRGSGHSMTEWATKQK